MRGRYIVYAVVAGLGVLSLLAQWRATGIDEADEGGAIPCIGVVLLLGVAIVSLIEGARKHRKSDE
jgi:hypothetical protein